MIGKYVTTNEFMLVFSCFSGFFGVIFGRCLGQMVFGRVTNVVHPWYFELKVLWELLTGRFEREYDIVQKDTHKSEK